VAIVPPSLQASDLSDPLAPLVGREQEVTAICELLRGDDVRLVTLTGPGGVGKTRLAHSVIATLRDAFGDDARFVDLAPVRDPDLVASAIAQALGVREFGDRPLIDRLRTALVEKRVAA
jgi:predicted ATPase